VGARGYDQGAGIAGIDFVGFGSDNLKALGSKQDRFTGRGAEQNIIKAPGFQRGT
jgi:hypothetical protein